MQKNLHQLLKQYWGYDAFRPMQEDIMRSVLDGKDTLAIMPTGGGKSLCYQVPAMAMEGACLVISPLIALMKDQVENLRKRGITAFAIFSGMSRREVLNTLKLVSESNCKFLYVSPERLETSLFLEYLPGMHINLVAIDEAHCISQWGYDFRPPYLRIAALRDELAGVPMLALTASATPDVQSDICDKLHFSEPRIFRQSFERPNLSYSAFKTSTRINKIVEIFNKVPGTGIVYCKSRKRTKEISDLLRARGIASDFYHAGLVQEERNRKQEEWIQNKIRVIVCTNAFGMGIDKPDVRAVVHADIPDCLENYYQEAGRAGRDGKTSYAVLLHDDASIADLEAQAEIRFPPAADIKALYQAVANYLQIPAGGGGGVYYDFDLADFVKKFKLNGSTAHYALKALEQDGWLSMNDQVFLPSTVQFNATKEHLYAYERDNPSLDPLIKTLLRSYEGIFDRSVFISELLVAQLMRKDQEDIKHQLAQLDRDRIIGYTPRKDKPQLMLLKNRVRLGDLSLNMVDFKRRKALFIKRVEAMTSFTLAPEDCRSVIIGNYFGDEKIRPCGICDNCLRRKATSLSKEEFNSIESRIIGLAKTRRISIKQLLQELKDIKKEKAWKVIEFLQAENKISSDAEGWIKAK